MDEVRVRISLVIAENLAGLREVEAVTGYLSLREAMVKSSDAYHNNLLNKLLESSITKSRFLLTGWRGRGAFRGEGLVLCP
jgi:hypothetical protein